MAINEFSFTIVPIDYSGENYRSATWINSGMNSAQFTEKIINSIKEKFVFLEEIGNLSLYGDPNKLRIYISITRGLLSSIIIRINVSYLDNALNEIQNVINIFTGTNVFCWTDNDNKMELEKETLISEIYKSRAIDFVNNPENYLKGE
jgi:hypothetical protein